MVVIGLESAIYIAAIITVVTGCCAATKVDSLSESVQRQSSRQTKVA